MFPLLVILAGVSVILIPALVGLDLPILYISIISTVLSLSGVALLVFKLNGLYILPLKRIHEWADKIHGGDFSAQIEEIPNSNTGNLISELNRFGREYDALSHNVDKMVHIQTQTLAQKTRSLEILYEVAARLNTSRNLNELLQLSLKTLMEIVHARAGSIRLLTKDNKLELVASIGLENDIVENYQVVSPDTCLVGNAMSEADILKQHDPKQYNIKPARPLFKGEPLEMVAVPLQHHDENLGICKLFIDTPNIIKRKDINDLLTSIGQHLGIAIEKARLDAESQRYSIIQERTLLANELHDSLAQTFASLRFQIRMLDNTLQGVGDKSALEEIEVIESGLDHANKELRELMAHFRIRMDERGLIPALEDIIANFSKDTGIATFFQNKCENLVLPPEYEVQILRIIQEALTNIRKHSKAHTTRILINCDGSGGYRILVEDDGIGISHNMQSDDSSGGEHIGRSVMLERAKQLNADLSIESEPGEGTQLILTFRYPEPAVN